MASLSEKIKVSLDECRMLVLGTQVLISLQFQVAFESSFNEAPSLSRNLVAVGLALLLLTFIFLQWGPVYHRVVFAGTSEPKAQEFLTWSICMALWPLSAALGADAFIGVNKLCGRPAGIGTAVAVVLLCAICWYGFSAFARRWTRRGTPTMNEKANGASGEKQPEVEKLSERVNQVLTEARIVLPGAQAMLGFQFVTMFTHEFDEMSTGLKLTHLACLGLIALTVVLLMTPAAFHRIAESGEDTERLVRVAARLIITAMIPLAMGVSGEFFVLVCKITGSMPLAVGAGASSLVLSFSLWFAYTTYQRRQRRSVSRRPVATLAHPH